MLLVVAVLLMLLAVVEVMAAARAVVRRHRCSRTVVCRNFLGCLREDLRQSGSR